MFYEMHKIATDRIETAYYHAGKAGAPKLLLLHGNASSAKFFLPLMKRLEDRYEMLAPDFRCFGDTEAKPIDATRGMRDFSDDVDAFVKAMQWDSFALLGWSMGGGVAMQYAIDHSEKLTHLILEAPLSPFGFGGTYDEDGKKLTPAGLASGGGCANPQLIDALVSGGRAFIAQTIDGVYVAPPYQIAPELKEMYIDSVLQTRVGEGMYPGDKQVAAVWPFFSSGTAGVNNTMSPAYCDLSGLADISNKVPVLWIRGDKDIMVADTSMMDLAHLGALGMVPGFPGAALCPPQPMLKQTRYVLERYRENGGSYEEVVIAGGHGCMLDNEDAFTEELLRFLS
ncbi:MAG: alpha/beta hydrolase [Lachnospiraceae bacterium]|nr:alpha/beta hydrolase [Lachnospiraceae bacterium]